MPTTYLTILIDMTNDPTEDENSKKSEKPEEAKSPENPLEDLKRSLDKIFGGRAVRLEFPNSVPPRATDTREEQDDGAETLKRIREFSMKPREIRDYLDRFVVKQDEAKKVLSVAICDHYNHVRRCLENPELSKREYGKQNILILGPTGVGKTYLMRTIAKLIGVPFVKADATKFSETGYVGGDVEDLVRNLVKAANGNVDIAQYGIIYIDEIDKIAGRGDMGGRDVSGTGVQINLLKLMEESDVNTVSPQDMMGQMNMMMSARGGKPAKTKINTRNILFIVSGAFDKLGEQIGKRMNRNAIGFGVETSDSDADPSEFLKYAETRDFIKYGFEAEFIGRLPVRVACEPLSAEDLADILVSSEGSILRQYIDDFKGYGIEFNITPEAVKKIAEKAHSEHTGARGLMTVLERTLRDFKFELPSSGIGHFEVSTDTVENPLESLAKLLSENRELGDATMSADITRFAEDFERETSYKLIFSPAARKRVLEIALETGKTPVSLCSQKFKDFKHGLAIVARNTDKREFEIPPEAVDSPDKWLSDAVVKSFKQ